MAAVADWVKTNLAVYSDNATARRDFRAQLRGNRAVILWSVYLLCLIGLAVLIYSEMLSRDSMSIVEAQSSLQQFYQVIMMLLAGMVTLVGPAMAATTVVIERERRSLDLVFSAPVRPKTLLVGKMISAYRYMWMLLILSLPISAVCVVLGGATWGEVLAAYAQLSLHALLFASMALMVSSMAPKPVSAIVWTYFLVGAYNTVVGLLSATSAFGSPRGGGFAGEAPFIVALSPFTSVLASGTYTSIGSWHVPNWVLLAIYVLFMARFFLLGAASVLSPYNSAETKNLKLTGMAAAVLVSGIIAFSQYKSFPWMAVGAGSSAMLKSAVVSACYLPLGLLIPLPLMTCFNLDAERRFRPNGGFSAREILRGTPAGGLPYALSLVLLMMLTNVVVFFLVAPSAVGLGSTLLGALAWAIGFWTLMWSFGRLTSSFSLDLKTARSLHLACIIAVIALPLMLLSIFDPTQSFGLWFAYVLYPPAYSDANALAYRIGAGIVMLGLAFLVYLRSEQIVRAKIQAKRKPPVVVEEINA